MAVENYIPVGVTGKELRTLSQSIGGRTVHTEAVAQIDGLVTTKQKTEFLPNSSRPTTIYNAYALQGSATSAAVWTIYKTVFTYDGTTNNITAIDKTTAVDVAWDNRAAATYT